MSTTDRITVNTCRCGAQVTSIDGCKQPHDHVRPRIEIEAPPVEVHELGEDGDMWIVLTDDPLVAEQRVRQWWAENLTPEDLQEQYGDVEPGELGFTFRDDWAWRPVDPAIPDDEAYLVRGDEGVGLKRFSGTVVTL